MAGSGSATHSMYILFHRRRHVVVDHLHRDTRTRDSVKEKEQEKNGFAVI